MSNDLISRNEVLSVLEKVFGNYGIGFGYSRGGFAEAVPKAIEAIPTTYDVDRVVEQLEECKQIMESPVQQDCYDEECNAGDCIVCAFEKAIKIAKEGGVNEQSITNII